MESQRRTRPSLHVLHRSSAPSRSFACRSGGWNGSTSVPQLMNDLHVLTVQRRMSVSWESVACHGNAPGRSRGSQSVFVPGVGFATLWGRTVRCARAVRALCEK